METKCKERVVQQYLLGTLHCFIYSTFVLPAALVHANLVLVDADTTVAACMQDVAAGPCEYE